MGGKNGTTERVLLPERGLAWLGGARVLFNLFVLMARGDWAELIPGEDLRPIDFSKSWCSEVSDCRKKD